MRRIAGVVALSLLSACGSNAPEVPPELLKGGSGCIAPQYADPPFGAEEGDVLQNACFSGFRAPALAAPSDKSLETIAFSDYYDPAGTRGIKLLLVNTAAVWCAACISEHKRLPEHYDQLAPQGLIILATLFQDAQRQPATIADLERWIDNFGTNFPMVVDPELQMAVYASPSSAPLNLVIDPRTMRIMRRYLGDQSSVMWPYIESELMKR